MSRNIFRETALERLASPEQLDQLMQVTTPKGWVALAALGGVIAAALGWGVFGSVPERVGGAGILVRSGGVFQVNAESDGRVAVLAVEVGDEVRQGQVVARLAQPDLAAQIGQARARVAERDAQHRRLAALGESDVALQAAYLAQSRAGLEETVRAGEAALRALDERVRNDEALAARGLITRAALQTTREQAERAREKVRTDRAQIAQLGVQELQARAGNQRQVEESHFQLDEARRELARLEGSRRQTSEVVSQYDGHVLDVLAERGGFVSRGQPLLTVDEGGRGALQAVVYVPSLHGKKVRPGMRIQIVPSTVEKEEHGFLLGRVTYVSAFPATQRGMQRVLKNEQLATALSGTDAPYEVHAELLPDTRAPSGYRWSSSRGPAVALQGGTLADARIVVERRRPISFLIPQLRRGQAAPARVAEASPRE